jgi:outer membrane biosynthesis protein TonB
MPGLRGKLTLGWEIDRKGKVRGVTSVANSLGDKDVARCVSKVIRRLRFEKPKKGGKCMVRWPFVFWDPN